MILSLLDLSLFLISSWPSWVFASICFWQLLIFLCKMSCLCDHFVCTLGLQLESLQYFCVFAFIKPCYSTSNACCLIGLASLNCLLSFVLIVDAFGTSLVELDSSLFHFPGRRTKCNGCYPCVSQRKFYTTQFVLNGYKICPGISFMQFVILFQQIYFWV